MKVLVLNGSPKQKSDTMRLTESFLKGFCAENACEITKIDVIRKTIKPCTGCFGCWQNGDGHCVQKDDQNEILDLYKEADVILWSFPLYCYSMPSHLKAVVDRTIPLVKMQMKEENGVVRHEPLIDFSKKRTLIICGAGFPNWDGNFEGLRIQLKNCFGNPAMVFVPETPLLNIPEAAPLANPLLSKFECAGREYAKTLSLSAETVCALETPMMPREVYLQHINA